MSPSLRELLKLDHRCFYCRERTDPPHAAAKCPRRAIKRRREALKRELDRLNATRPGKKAKTQH